MPRRAGWAPRLGVLPRRVSARRGLKPRLAQEAAWKRAERLWTASSAELKTSGPPDQTLALVALGSQLVGLRVNRGLSTLTRMSLTFSGMPWRMWGIGSEDEPSASTSAVSGSIRSASWVTTVPASKGPAIAGTLATTLKGAPL